MAGGVRRAAGRPPPTPGCGCCRGVPPPHQTPCCATCPRPSPAPRSSPRSADRDVTGHLYVVGRRCNSQAWVRRKGDPDVARVVDDDMNDVSVGQVGEIVYRAPTLMAGYWNDPQATAEAFAGGWFHSGDLVRMDEEGYVWVPCPTNPSIFLILRISSPNSWRDTSTRRCSRSLTRSRATPLARYSRRNCGPASASHNRLMLAKVLLHQQFLPEPAKIN